MIVWSVQLDNGRHGDTLEPIRLTQVLEPLVDPGVESIVSGFSMRCG